MTAEPTDFVIGGKINSIKIVKGSTTHSGYLRREIAAGFKTIVGCVHYRIKRLSGDVS